MENLNLVTEWDKTFQKSEKVNHSKVTFPTKYGFIIAADVYVPKDVDGKMAAIAVCGPYGAVKEQSSGLYAQTMAERGFVTLAFDPSYTGESSGLPRNTSSPDINTEDYSAAVDYLVTRDDVDEDKIGIIGICGWGGMALSVAAKDARIKATVGSTSANHSDYAPEQRKQGLQMVNAQRSLTAKTGEVKIQLTVPETVTEDMPQFVKDFHAYYRMPRGYHPRGINSGLGYDVTSNSGLMNFSLFTYTDQIDSAVLMVHGDAAFTYSQGQDLFSRLKGDNKKFISVAGASHTDLYDKIDKIPFDKIEKFFKEYLK